MKAPHSASNSSPSPTSMYTPKPSVYPGHPGQHSSPSSITHPHSLPSHQHPGMYMSYPHPPHPSHSSSPGLGQHIPPPHHQIHPQLHALSSRGTVPRASVPHQGGLSLGNVAAASTPPLQVSPPLHSQAHLGGLHSPHHQHLGGHNLGMTHSPAITQVRPHLMSNRKALISVCLNRYGTFLETYTHFLKNPKHKSCHFNKRYQTTDFSVKIKL